MARPRKLPRGLWERNGVYYSRFTANGRLVRQRLSSDFKSACTILNDLRARADRGDFGIVDNDCPWESLKEKFIKWKWQTGRNPQRYEEDIRIFEAYLKPTSIRQIDHGYAIGFRNWRLEGGGPKAAEGKVRKTVTKRTINRQIGVLSAMLNKGVEWKLIGSNPLAGLKPLRHDVLAKDRRSLTLAEVERLFAASPAYLRPMWRAFMCTGLRRNELVSMKFSDVDFERRTVIVRASTAKTHKSREVPLDDETFETVVRLRDEAKHRQPVPGKTAKATAQQLRSFSREHVFVTTANTPWKNNLLKRFYSVCRQAEIDGAHVNGSVDIHSLRVSFTTLSLENGANPKAVQSILGHSTLTLTMGVYAKATDVAKRHAVGALPFASVRKPDHVLEIPTAHSESTSSQKSTQTPTLQCVG